MTIGLALSGGETHDNWSTMVETLCLVLRSRELTISLEKRSFRSVITSARQDFRCSQLRACLPAVGDEKLFLGVQSQIALPNKCRLGDFYIR